MNTRALYSEEEFFKEVLKTLIYVEPEGTTRTLISTQPTETNDGPKEEPLGIRLKLPPFKGWPEELQ